MTCRVPLLIAALTAAALCPGQPAAQPDPFKGAISGRLFDDFGQPFPGWHVVLGQWRYRSGRREFDLLQPDGTSTRDDGSFVFGNLDPGTYSVRAENPYRFTLDLDPSIAQRLPALPGPKQPGEAYVTTYYPGVLDAPSSAAIAVTAGAETRGIEFRIRSERVFRIRGKVIEPRIGRFGSIMTIKPQDSLVPEDNRHANVGADKTFVIEGVLPGRYIIDEYSNDYTNRIALTVTDRDVDNVTVELKPCPKINGRITLDGTPSESNSRTGLMLSHLSEAIGVGGSIKGDGALSVSCAQPERYTVGLPIQPGTYIKSITVDGKDFTNAPLDLTSPADKTLNIVLSSKAADIKGVAREASGAPQPGVPVTAWSPGGDFNVTAEADPNGAFAIGNLPPGTYRIAAWDQLRTQPQGWGVQTVRDFRSEFDSAAPTFIVAESQHLNVDAALIPRHAIEDAASRLRLNAVMTHPAATAEISLAVKSPATLARYVESHQNVDWKAVRSALGLKESEDWLAPCGSDFPAGSSPCTAEIAPVSNPDQAIVIVHGGDFSYTVEFLRYLQVRKDVWQFAGEFSAFQRNSPSHYEFLQFGTKPFLKISSDHSQNGMATQQVLEDWFDLTQPDFDSVFSFTPEGGQSRFGFGVGRTIEAKCVLTQSAGIEQIDMTLSIHFDGPGLDLPATYGAIYERVATEKMFTIRNAYSGSDRRTPIATKDFEELAEPFSELTNEKLLAYALTGLEKIATGSDADAKEWLQSILSEAKDTPEKKALLELLKKR